jgi:hypothetical protein
MGVSYANRWRHPLLDQTGSASKRMSKMVSSIRSAANDWGSVTNAQKHASSDRKSGLVRIGALDQKDCWRCTVKDNGVA